MIISLHKYLYFSTEIHPRLPLVAIFKYPDNTQERGIKPKKVTLSLKNVIFGLVCRDYVILLSLVTTHLRSHGIVVYYICLVYHRVWYIIVASSYSRSKIF